MWWGGEGGYILIHTEYKLGIRSTNLVYSFWMFVVQCEDMANLTFLNDASVFWNLKTRYQVQTQNGPVTQIRIILIKIHNLD